MKNEAMTFWTVCGKQAKFAESADNIKMLIDLANLLQFTR